MDEIKTLPLLALRGLIVFPQMLVHFDVGREKSIRAIEAAMSENQQVFLVAQRDLRSEEPDFDDLYEVGTVARICQILKLPGDNMRVMVEGVARAKISNRMTSEPYFLAEIAPVKARRRRVSEDQVEAIIRQAYAFFDEYARLAPRLSAELAAGVTEITDPGHLADFIAQNMVVRHEEKQTILELSNPIDRLTRVISLLSHENEILDIEHNIQNKLRQQLSKNQREYFLREQIKTIQDELGESENLGQEVDEYRDKIKKLRLAELAEDKLLAEVNRLSHMHTSSPESAVIRTWLDTCLALPWNKNTREKLDIAAASRTLDADHYGLAKVKERILEFLAVKKLAPQLKGEILCLVGPPGVGKTSVATSVARAMGRKMGRLSLGGVRDEADIRGHRKTYIGAMPGRILTAVSQAGTRNAVLVLDEIDKLGHDFRGDPAAALLELFDVKQNAEFRDHYVELPFDLSDILFLTTANTTETIPPALLDRMEIIELSSYTDEEKLQIAKKHLWRKQLARHGLSRNVCRVSDTAIREVIAGYTRESGVRQLERELAALCRKSAMEIVGGAEKVTIRPEHLETYLGVRKYKPERLHGAGEVGVATGLAWTRVGGELLDMEVGVVKGSGKIDLTGNLGDVMKESARAALTYIRSRAGALGLEPDFHKNYDIHIHFPSGAIPKDGPSAGISSAVAMISALTGAPVNRDVALTGEITLRGRVLPIGGLKEKTMAAFRAGVHTVILPRDNEKDLADIDPAVRQALHFVLADHMDAVLPAAIDFAKRPVRGDDVPLESMLSAARPPVAHAELC